MAATVPRQKRQRLLVARRRERVEVRHELRDRLVPGDRVVLAVAAVADCASAAA